MTPSSRFWTALKKNRSGAEDPDELNRFGLQGTAGHIPTSRLLEIASDVRRFLEPVWPVWQEQLYSDRENPASVLSTGLCIRSSVFLNRVLKAEGVNARWVLGFGHDGRGFYDSFSSQEGWRTHAWVETANRAGTAGRGSRIIDITSDQFPGYPPITITDYDDIIYRRGRRDFRRRELREGQYPGFKQKRSAIIDEIWPLWMARKQSQLSPNHPISDTLTYPSRRKPGTAAP